MSAHCQVCVAQGLCVANVCTKASATGGHHDTRPRSAVVLFRRGCLTLLRMNGMVGGHVTRTFVQFERASIESGESCVTHATEVGG